MVPGWPRRWGGCECVGASHPTRPALQSYQHLVRPAVTSRPNTCSALHQHALSPRSRTASAGRKRSRVLWPRNRQPPSVLGCGLIARGTPARLGDNLGWTGFHSLESHCSRNWGARCVGRRLPAAASPPTAAAAPDASNGPPASGTWTRRATAAAWHRANLCDEAKSPRRLVTDRRCGAATGTTRRGQSTTAKTRWAKAAEPSTALHCRVTQKQTSVPRAPRPHLRSPRPMEARAEAGDSMRVSIAQLRARLVRSAGGNGSDSKLKQRLKNYRRRRRVGRQRGGEREGSVSVGRHRASTAAPPAAALARVAHRHLSGEVRLERGRQLEHGRAVRGRAALLLAHEVPGRGAARRVPANGPARGRGRGLRCAAAHGLRGPRHPAPHRRSVGRHRLVSSAAGQAASVRACGRRLSDSRWWCSAAGTFI